MFTIIISEKGGAERREGFDRGEINVGRVQGNDLMLPKGNVSKHHARLLYRDGRFIVTDLKSTNGTYVNGRKISQATIVREGDKIYIGDFVLRLEVGQGAEGAERGPAAEAVGAPVEPPAGAVVPPPLPPQAGSIAPPPPLPEQPVVSHYPLERDPDSESAPEWPGAPAAQVPGPPRVPQPVPVRARANTAVMQHPDRVASVAPAPRAAPPAAAAAPGGPAGQAGAVRSVATAARSLPRETPQQAARRLALITLVDRVADAMDLSSLDAPGGVEEAVAQRVERVVREQAKAMRDEGEAPEGIDFDLLARDALRELVSLGPLGPLLEDEDVSDIHVVRPDYLLVVRKGQAALADPAFTSEEALGRIVARLAHQSGDPLRSGDVLVERRLARGRLVAIAPPASSGWVLTIRKRRRIEVSLEELVRGGAMSRPMAHFLEACVGARANVLVVGSGSGAVATAIGALASAVPAGERVALLQDAEEVGIPQAQVIQLAPGAGRGEASVQAAARLGPDRIVVASANGAVAAAVVDIVAGGCDGVLVGVAAPSLRHGLARLATHIALGRPGTSVDVAREAIGESFDVALEVLRLPDGRLRVQRVAELAGADAKGVVARDLFQSSVEGTGESGFIVTGTTPRIALDLAARGIKLDATLFKRAR
ncbi:MAG TPA: ATPase, T2SS/T4P/T4SS family [Polyangiaceae bacterium]|nr:ATPase, T2SS/T4P/T4SS family [Polyangiaceae bacterium]